MMHGIRNIIFDLGGVILPIDISITTNRFRELGIGKIDEYFAHGHATSFFRDLEQGLISDEEFVDSIRDLVAGRIPADMVIDTWNALLLDFPPERITLLKDLGRDYRVFLFSNTNGIHHKAFLEKYRKAFDGESFDSLFETAWYSHLIKRRKPDVSSFQYVLNEGNLMPGETLFIDDALVNIQGAEQAGIRGYHLTPGQSITDLGWN